MEGDEAQCRQCYGVMEGVGRCDECGSEDVVDLSDGEARRAWVEELRERALEERGQKIKWMRVATVAVAAAFWVAGLWMVADLGEAPVVLSWVVKMVAVAMVAAGWWSAPRIHDQRMAGKAQRWWGRLEGPDLGNDEHGDQ